MANHLTEEQDDEMLPPVAPSDQDVDDVEQMLSLSDEERMDEIEFALEFEKQKRLASIVAQQHAVSKHLDYH